MSSLSTAHTVMLNLLPDPDGPGQKAECRKIAVFMGAEFSFLL